MRINGVIMAPSAPSANPQTSNTNLPFGGFGQAQSDYGTAANILNYLPTQENTTTSNAKNANNNPGSILPSVNINAPTYTAPTAQTINAGSYGSNLTGYNQAVQSAEQNQIAQENQTYASAQGSLASAENQYGNLTPVYQKLASEYNIPGYQSDVATLSGLLQHLNQDVNAQTTLGGGLMTQSARDEMYANEANPLNMALNSAGEFLNYGQQDVNNLLGTYEKSLSNALTPLESNISNLPGLFGQANSAAESGYNQGATAIESQISNAQRQQEIATQQEQAAAFNREVNAQYGNGNGMPVLGGGNNKTQAATYGLKVANNPSAGYYFEDANGNPINAVQYAKMTGIQPMQVITAMANSGDTGAKQLLNEINIGAAGMDPNAVIQKYYGNF